MTNQAAVVGRANCKMRAKSAPGFNGRLLVGVSSTIVAALISVSPAMAANCVQDAASPGFGVEPAYTIDATCTDPDFNESNFVIDSVTENVLLAAPYAQIPFTRVIGHFTPTKTAADVAAVYPAGSPSTAQHGVRMYFPPKELWQKRFFHHVYPLDGGSSNPDALSADVAANVDFALQSGGYFVDLDPGNPLVGYRVDAAAAKIAKAYAKDLYDYEGRIYGYVWGGSGGSYIVQGAVERTSGVWDGAVPYVIAMAGLTSSGAQQQSLYAMRIPSLAKRQAIAAAAQVGSGVDPFAGLTEDEKAALLELMRFGYPLPVLGTGSIGIGIFGDGRTYDPTYEEDFWTEPGYEGYEPTRPAYVQAALVDHFATITAVTKNAQGVPTSITLDSQPTLGSIGASGLESYVYLADGTTRVFAPATAPFTGVNLAASVLAGNRSGTTITVNSSNNQALLNALVVGNKIRINNRYVIAVSHYSRHGVPKNRNIQFDQYTDASGNPLYPQRENDASNGPTLRTTGSVLPTGKINFPTIAVTNMLDSSAFHLTGAAYAELVRTGLGQGALGSKKFGDMFRIYYQDSADHFGRSVIAQNSSNRLVSYVPVLYQTLRDLSAWVETGKQPPKSTEYSLMDGQVILPATAASRRGIQPVVHLSVNGSDGAVVGVNQPVTLTGRIEVPPSTGKILNYDWYLGGNPVVYEAPIVLTDPAPIVDVERTVSFANPGTYFISLRTKGQRDSKPGDPTAIQNLDRVRIVVE